MPIAHLCSLEFKAHRRWYLPVMSSGAQLPLHLSIQLRSSGTDCLADLGQSWGIGGKCERGLHLGEIHYSNQVKRFKNMFYG